MPEKTAPARCSRRRFLHQMTEAGALVVWSSFKPAWATAVEVKTPITVSIFSKHLQWLEWEPMAETAARIGFDGVDLTVRGNGHVLPERVEQDLPRAAEAIRKSGLSIPMVTAGIVDTRSPHAEAILRALRALSIPRYRWGGFRYSESQTITNRLEELKPRVAELAAWNKKYNLCAMYHTHSGAEVGASMWDLWVLLKDFEPQYVGVNFDIGHAKVEGGLGAWVNNTRLLAPFIKGVAVKDFRWQKNAKGEWRPHWCPLGEGMVNFQRFFAMLKTARFSGPIQLHFEYPLGGAESGARKLTIEKEKIIAAMQQDLTRLKGWLREAQLL